MFKSRKNRVLISLILVWLLISVYFYFQHTVTVKNDLIFEKMDFADETIILTELQLDKYQRKTRDVSEDIPWYYQSKIPPQILYRILETAFFYSSPYTKYGDRGFLTVKGLRIASTDNREPDKIMDDFSERYDIRITDSSDKRFSMDSRNGAYIPDNSDILYFYYDEIPVADDIETVKVTVTDTQTGLSKSISIHPEWDEEVINYFERNRVSYGSFDKSKPNEIARYFVINIVEGNTELLKNCLHPNCKDTFDWSALDHELWDSPYDKYVLYEGSYQDYQDVFSYNMYFEDSHEEDAQIIGKQKIYLVFDQDKWQIIDVSPLDKVLIIGDFNENYEPPEYDPQKSITYNKPYTDLSAELLYARLQENTSEGKKTVRVLRHKQDLIDIVREFDKLKAVYPEDSYQLTPDTGHSYVVTMWREGTSVSYVIYESEQEFYYRERPAVPLRKMPDNLVSLLGFKD